MRKGQSGTIALVIMGLVIVGLLAFIAFKLTTPSATDNVVYSPQTNIPTTSSPQDYTPYQTQPSTNYKPSKYVTGSAVVNPPFYMNAWNVKTDAVNLELRNNGGEDYFIQSIRVTDCGGNYAITPISAGTSASITIPCALELTAGNTFSGDITITYRKVGSRLVLTSTGTIAEKVQ